jgi:hypothetical protein
MLTEATEKRFIPSHIVNPRCSAPGDSQRVRRVALDCIPGAARKYSEGGTWITQPTRSRKAKGTIACCGTVKNTINSPKGGDMRQKRKMAKLCVTSSPSFQRGTPSPKAMAFHFHHCVSGDHLARRHSTAKRPDGSRADIQREGWRTAARRKSEISLVCVGSKCPLSG